MARPDSLWTLKLTTELPAHKAKKQNIHLYIFLQQALKREKKKPPTMSYFIIDHLKKIPPEERQATAEHLLRTFHNTHHIPKGYYYPQEWDEQKIKEYLGKETRFYTQIAKLIPNPPKAFFTEKKRFERAKRSMLKLAQLTEKQRQNIPLHKLPEYAWDFQAAIQKQFYDRQQCLSPLSNNSPSTQIV